MQKYQTSQSPQPLTSADIRSQFLAFFEKRGHMIIPSASLVTSDEKGITNPTLFNTAGMQPLIPYLLGKKHPKGNRLVNAQKCLRTTDLDDVGDKTHATFFEMLGNWSLGAPPAGYFKKEAIQWSYEFLTNPIDGENGDKGLGLDPRRFYVTVFEGDMKSIPPVPRDDEAANIWREIFKKNKIEGERIFYMPAEMNWWSAGDNGPCGPDTEMYYDIGAGGAPSGALNGKFAGKGMTRQQFISADKARDVVEVWNDVFMQYEKKDGKIIGNLPSSSVDTGAGLERLAMTLQGVDNIYDTDLFKPVIDLMKNSNAQIRNKRIVSDHIRASIFLIADGVIPSNTDRGYILRRLIRRAIINTTDKKIDSAIISKFVDTFVAIYAEAYPELVQKSESIKKILNDECAKFAEALVHGMKEFEKIVEVTVNNSVVAKDIAPHAVFELYSSYGLPFEIIIEMAREKGLGVDEIAFEKNVKEHQSLSRAGAEQKFKGGLANVDNPMIVRYHTATHLLHQALHDVLGGDVINRENSAGNQKGSNITAERLRFDFSYGAKLTDEQKKRVEDIVNEKIAMALPVNKIILPREEALKIGARHLFGEKYGEQISIYFIGDDLAHAYSKEFCGGPHVENTRELAGPDGTWHFKIQKEEAVAQGIRRIKALLA